MKEKIKKILFIIAEIGTVIWAISGMWQVVSFQFLIGKDESLIRGYVLLMEDGVNFLLIPLLFYFLSAVLILYLLRKYDSEMSRHTM